MESLKDSRKVNEFKKELLKNYRMETLNCLSPHWGELVLCFIGFVVILYLIFKPDEYTKVEAEVVKISPISCECVF